MLVSPELDNTSKGPGFKSRWEPGVFIPLKSIWSRSACGGYICVFT